MYLSNRPLSELTLKQSLEIHPDEKTRRSRLYTNNLWSLCDSTPQTILECFEHGMQVAGKDAALYGMPSKDGKYQLATYGDVERDSLLIGAKFAELGLECQRDYVAVIAANSYEYNVIVLGGYRRNLASICLCQTINSEQLLSVIDDTNLKVIFVDSATHLNQLLKLAANSLEVIVLMKHFDGEIDLDLVQLSSIHVMRWASFMISSIEPVDYEQIRPTSESIAMISYSSGTTATAKGAIITHRNVCTVAVGVVKWTAPVKLCQNDVWFSYLPMAHIFERVIHIALYTVGGQVWFSSGRVENMFAEVKKVKPTIFGSVPAVLQMLYDKIQTQMTKSTLKRLVIGHATASKRQLLDKGFITNRTVWDKVFLRQFQSLLGGRVHTWVSGSGVINAAVRGLIREVFGCMILECYGLTECCGCASATNFANYQREDECVGPPQPWNEIKLVPLDDAPYAEVYIRGDNVIRGYINGDAVTNEEGWLATGDVGEWMPNGTLRIIDRKRDLIRLNNGTMVAPQRTEKIYELYSSIKQVFVYGTVDFNAIVAVIVPNGELDELFLINCFAAKHTLSSSEHISGFIIGNEFTVENGLLTPTRKLRRNKILDVYKGELLELLNKSLI